MTNYNAELIKDKTGIIAKFSVPIMKLQHERRNN